MLNEERIRIKRDAILAKDVIAIVKAGITISELEEGYSVDDLQTWLDIRVNVLEALLEHGNIESVIGSPEYFALSDKEKQDADIVFTAVLDAGGEKLEEKNEEVKLDTKLVSIDEKLIDDILLLIHEKGSVNAVKGDERYTKLTNKDSVDKLIEFVTIGAKAEEIKEM